MIALSTRSQWLIACLLMLLLTVTRGHHFTSLTHLPGASWAVFFLAGVYLRSRSLLLFLLALAAVVDYSAITYGGVSDFCVSSAYVLLLPAYTCLWLAGRWYSRQYCLQWLTLLSLSAALLVGATLCELFSSGGFYFFSGRFEETTLVEFGERLVKYFPPNLQAMAFYVAMAAFVHLVFALVSETASQQDRTTG